VDRLSTLPEPFAQKFVFQFKSYRYVNLNNAANVNMSLNFTAGHVKSYEVA